MKLFLMSLGCNKNLVDSEIMLGRLQHYELTNEPAEADVLIINTCGFIESAKSESIAAILDTHAVRKAGSLLVVTGCLAQRYAAELARELPEVDLITGVSDYERIDELIAKRESSITGETYLNTAAAARVVTGSNSHAFIKIAEGCNQRCSFCAIPTFKGKLKSRTVADIAQEVRGLVARGFYDFSFIAQDTSSFGRDARIADGLEQLIDAIERIPGVLCARILYLYPSSLSERLIARIIASPVFANYFDIPLQHASDKMLRIMARGYKIAQAESFLAQMAAAPEAFIRSGFIVGHPGEDEEDFAQLCAFLERAPLDRISVFAYSREEDTAAYDMPQLEPEVIAARLATVEQIVARRTEQSFARLAGQKMLASIIGESSEGELFIGAKPLAYDREIDAELLINESEVAGLRAGDLVRVRVNEVRGISALATVLERLER